MSDQAAIDRRQLLRRGAAGALALSVPAALTACGSDNGRAAGAPTGSAVGARPGAPARGGTLRAAFGSSPQDSIDPTRVNDTLGGVRVRNAFEPLTISTVDGLQHVLAESIEPSRDGTVWTIRVRDGVTFHDGRPLSADDVLFSILRLRGNPELGPFLGPIEPARSRAIDRRTVRLHLTEPAGDLDLVLAKSYLPMVRAGARFRSARDLVGTGPFRVLDVALGQRTVLERNPDYWGAGPGRGPYLDRIELIAITDPGARMRALRAGQVDWAAAVAYGDADAQRGNRHLQLVPSRRPLALGFVMSPAAGIVDDSRVRLALKLGIDRRALVRTITYGFGEVGNDLWGQGWPAYDGQIPQRPHDPERARHLLTSAGHSHARLSVAGGDFEPGLGASATALVEQLTAMGIHATGTQVPVAAYSDFHGLLGHQLVGFGFEGSFVEYAPIALLSNGVFNYGWKRPGWDRGYARARATLDPARRQQRLDALQRQTWADGYELIWGGAPAIVAAGERVRGIRADVPEPFYPSFAGVGFVA